MITSHIQLLGLAGVLVSGSLLLLAGGGSQERRLRDRVLATRDLKAREPGTAQFLVLGQDANRRPLTRALELLGYRRDIPSPFNASLRIVIPAAAIVGVLVYNVAAFLLSPVLAVALGVLTLPIMCRVLFRRSVRAYESLLFRQIPDAMSLILRAVRAGLPVAEAIRSVGTESIAPTRQEFSRVAGETALGMPLELALRRLYERTNVQEYAFFSVVIGLQGQTGGNLSETLENLADMVRRRVAMVGKARALSAEGRMSAAVVGALPFVVGLLISLLNPGYMTEFLSNPKGPALIGAFFVLLGMGLLSTHWLIQRSIQD